LAESHAIALPIKNAVPCHGSGARKFDVPNAYDDPTTTTRGPCGASLVAFIPSLAIARTNGPLRSVPRFSGMSSEAARAISLARSSFTAKARSLVPRRSVIVAPLATLRSGRATSMTTLGTSRTSSLGTSPVVMMLAFGIATNVSPRAFGNASVGSPSITSKSSSAIPNGSITFE